MIEVRFYDVRNCQILINLRQNSYTTNKMNIALIGYGRMGHEIEAAALSRGHKVGLIVDIDNIEDLNIENITANNIDVAIEFTIPSCGFDNVSKCLTMGLPVVSGTTGWDNRYEEAVSLCKEKECSFLHSSNFSIGVNILFQLNAALAKYLNKYPEYKVDVTEIHHTKKLDAPSGTAITLTKGIINNNSNYNSWLLNGENEGVVPVTAIREGDVPGTHIIKWDSPIDTLTISHEAKNRKGLALGAVVAAEYIAFRKGVFTMNEVLFS